MRTITVKIEDRMYKVAPLTVAQMRTFLAAATSGTHDTAGWARRRRGAGAWPVPKS